MRNTCLIAPVSTIYGIPAAHVARYLSWRFGARQYRVRESAFGGSPVVEALASACEGVYPNVGSDGRVYSFSTWVSHDRDRGWVNVGTLEGYVRDLAEIRAADADLYAALTAR